MHFFMQWSHRHRVRAVSWVVVLVLFSQSTLLPVAARPASPVAHPHAVVTQPLGPEIARRSVLPPTPNVTPASLPAHAALQPTDSRSGRATIPLIFLPNAGQRDPAVRFEALGLGGLVGFGDQQITFTVPQPSVPTVDAPTLEAGRDPQAILAQWQTTNLAPIPSSTVTLQFLGAKPAPLLNGTDPQFGRVNSYRGASSRAWQRDLPTYAGLRYQDLYPGIDLDYVGSGAALKGTYTIAPQHDPRQIRWHYTGA